MTAYDRILDALHQHGGTVRSTGTGKASAQCPAHEDGAPSLSVTGIEGQTLVHCHAGCATLDVLAALELGMADLYDEPKPRRRKGIPAHAVYHYDNGRDVIRSAGKEFRQDHTEAPAELYRVGKVRAAVAEGRRVYVVEGEKDVHALETLGVTATCAPMGAGKWRQVDPAPLYGGTVHVIADQDEPGRKHAADVLESLAGHADATLFAPKVGKDSADHIAAGYGVADFRAIAQTPAPPAGNVEQSKPDEPKKSAATMLVELAQSRYVFGISTDGEPFAVPLIGDPVARLLRGGKRGLRSELARDYFEKYSKAVSQQALADALLVIEGIAGGSDPVPLAQRVAQTSTGWWVDLGDTTGDAILINGAGWTITAPAVRFRRTVLTAALPRPVAGGDLAELWALLNVAEHDRPLVLAWLVAAIIAGIPHPILNLAGEQGTGKSTAARIITSLLDPSPVPLRKAPRDAESWVTAAAGSWIVALDNLAAVADWLSDTLCRAVTGDGDVRRQLYTDGGLALFAFRRAVILNGIDLGAVRGDLADRLLVIDLDVIDEHHRRLDADVEARWQEAHPRILGALLDLAASVASVLPSVHLERSPRMADFARILEAVDQVAGTDGFDRYLDRGRNLATDSLTADPFVIAMQAQLDTNSSGLFGEVAADFIGTSAELLAQIEPPDEKRLPKDWPANARQLTTLLKRQAPVMRRAGWSVVELPPGHHNALRWQVARPEKARNGDSRRSRRSQAPAGASDASVASVEYGPSKDDGLDLYACPACGAPTGPSRAGPPSLCASCTLTELNARQEGTA